MLLRPSLKLRLGLGAGLLGLATLVTALLLAAGMAQVSRRLDTVLAAEARLDHYAALSTQVSTFIVVAAEVIQRGLPAETRAARTASTAETIQRSFTALRAGLQAEMAETTGLDAQSRRATQSLAIARIEAQFASALAGLTAPTGDSATLRAYLDTFASGVEPLLAEAVNEEKRLRTEILTGIQTLRARLTLAALAIAGLAMALSAAFYFGLVRPQFRRLDALRGAAQRIGREEFALALPEGAPDEIGQLAAETNRSAQALAARAQAVAQDRARLNDTIRARTEDLQQANTRLERIDEDRRRLFADISHELRTPLTVILMEAQLGQTGAPDPETAFATIESRASRLSRRIDDLLRIARSETGQLALDLQTVDLAALARDAAEETAAEVESAGMTLTLPSPAPLPVTADANWLRQVIVSLIRNAIRHARAGGTIALDVANMPDSAEIALRDNGPGIAPEAQARLFDRFTQGTANSAQGFGLGLALARWVVEQQGGSIAATSPLPRAESLGPNPGTKIAVRIPRASD